MRVALSRLLIYLHRWLGIVLGILFVGWFVSGIVMMYARMPRLSPAERELHMAALDFSAARVAPIDAARAIDGRITGLRLEMAESRPLYRFIANGRARLVFADTGEVRPPADEAHALAAARQFAPGSTATMRYDALIDAPDQWTLETARLLPMHRIALGDADDTTLYVAVATGDVVLDTRGRERRWAYPGAILHWIYLTPIRRHGAAWAQFIIWSSVAGTVMCVAGLVWGVWRYSPFRGYRLKRQATRSPYAGWMRWHHYAGLMAGITTLTWVFSGLLSMDPWDWHPDTSPSGAQRLAFSGDAWTLEDVTLERLQYAVQMLGSVKEAEVVRFQRATYLSAATGAAALAATGGLQPFFDRGALMASAARAGNGVTIDDASWLDRYDAYYYDRDGELPLPVMRVKYHDPQRTWLYVSASRGLVVRKEERLTRLNRWLYHGLHSLDFPFLYYRRPLWDLVVIVLSLAGLTLSVTTMIPALRRLRRRGRELIG